jgi:Domain of unknown function (DUF1707)
MNQYDTVVAPHLRLAADQDREQAIADLGEALSAGRLDADEHASRVSAALASKTLGQLWNLTADIPRATAVVMGPAQPSWRPLPVVPTGYRPVGVAYLGPGGWSAPYPGQSAPIQVVAPVRSNAAAIVALVVSLAALFTSSQILFGVPIALGLGAIALGIIGRRQIARSHWTEGGSAAATAAVAIGAAALLIGALVLAAHLS